MTNPQVVAGVYTPDEISDFAPVAQLPRAVVTAPPQISAAEAAKLPAAEVESAPAKSAPTRIAGISS